jgi:hypothetical protein
VTASLQELATLLGGHVNHVRNCVSCPAPGHSAADSSLSVWPADNENGFTVNSFTADWRDCVEHVKSKLDPEKRAALAALGAATPARDDKAERAEDDPLGPGWYARWRAPNVEPGPSALEKRLRRPRDIWNTAVSPIGTIVEVYLWRRHLDLEPDVAGPVLRYHPELPWKDKLTGKLFRTNAMVAALRDIQSNEVVGVHCTRLSPIGEKIERRFRGIFAGTAVKLDADDTVIGGLHIGEGIETCLTARQLGLRPTWAICSKDPIGEFPVLSGVECLTILAEPDAEAKVVECAQRWHAAGREVLINRAIGGKDLNDSWRAPNE